MLQISTTDTLLHVLKTGCDPGLDSILKRYEEHFQDDPIAKLFIIQPGDERVDLERCRGRPFELWEYISRADGWYEAVFIISDDGFGHIVIIPDQPEIAGDLLAICKAHAR